MIEKDDIDSNAKEEFKYTFTDTDGNEQSQTKQRPKAVSLHFMEHLLNELPVRGANAWKTFDYYLEVIAAFFLFSPEQFEKNGDLAMESLQVKKESEAYTIGIELCFKWNMFELLGDFILGEKSPKHTAGE